MYSPKHRHWSMYLTAIFSDRPQGHRRLRFSFSLHLSKNSISRCKRLPNTTAPHPGISGLSRHSVREILEQPLDGQPRDEPDLRSFASVVNPRFDLFGARLDLPSEDDSLRRTNFASRPRSGRWPGFRGGSWRRPLQRRRRWAVYRPCPMRLSIRS